MDPSFNWECYFHFSIMLMSTLLSRHMHATLHIHFNGYTWYATPYLRENTSSDIYICRWLVNLKWTWRVPAWNSLRPKMYLWIAAEHFFESVWNLADLSCLIMYPNFYQGVCSQTWILNTSCLLEIIIIIIIFGRNCLHIG